MCFALLGFDTAWCAGNEAAATQVKRVLHVCDCPAAMANEERAQIIAALAGSGYVQGRNLELVTYDYFSAGQGSASTLLSLVESDTPATRPYAKFLSEEMTRMKPAVILASGVRVAQGARAATGDTPVVFWRVTDPVSFGIVESLARPGANLTGFSRAIEKLTAKRLELLHEMLPGARRFGFLFMSDYEHHRQQAQEAHRAAQSSGLDFVDYALPMNEWSSERLDETFAHMRTDKIDAFLLPDIVIQGPVVAALAAKHGLATIHALALAVTEWGGLAAYTTAADDELPGVAAYAVRILKGRAAREFAGPRTGEIRAGA